jgi:peptidoglycan/LPS O-acetylase OafA/YrhL
MSISYQGAAFGARFRCFRTGDLLHRNAAAGNSAITSEAQQIVTPTTLAASTTRSEAARHLTNLDFLRAVVVGLVFTGHLMETAKIRGLGDLGHFGVLLFFVHTSFVLMLSMQSLNLTGYRLYSVFLVRKIFGIYPLSVLAVLAAVTFHIPSTAWLTGYMWAGWPAFFSNLLLTQNITHSWSVICVLWSLPFELQMYAVLPAIYLLLSRFPSTKTALLTLLTGMAIAGAEYVARAGSCDLEVLLTRYFPCFLAGVLAWQLVSTTSTRHRRLPGALWIVLLTVLVVFYRVLDALRVYGPALLGALHGTLRSDHGVWWPPFLDLVNDWAFCGITWLAIPHFAGISIHWLNAISSRIAQYSYGIYVSHVPLLWLCFKRLHIGSLAVSSVLSLILTAIVSMLLYHMLEDPAIRFGKRLAGQFDRCVAIA